MKKLMLLAATLLLCARVRAVPPPITDAEKAACELVAAYLSSGPSAVASLLAPGTPLALLGPAPKLAEIEARMGPRNAARWELRTAERGFAEHGAVFHVVFASGVEDVVTIDLVRSGDRWNVRELRTMAELPPVERDKRAVSSSAPAAHAAVAATPHWFDDHVLYLLLIAPFLAAAGAVLRRHRLHLSSAFLIVALVCFAVPISALLDPSWPARARARLAPSDSATAVARKEPPLPFARMRGLVASRNALAAGEKFDPNRGSDEEAKQIARVWTASAAFGVTPAESKRELERLQNVNANPLAILLRARVALAEGRNEVARKEYAALRAIEPAHDAFWMEEALAQPDQKGRAFDAVQTRDAAVHYARFFRILATRNEGQARLAFQEAWRIQPLPRETIVSSVFSFLLRDPAFAVLLNLNQPDERKSADVDLARSPMSVPPGTTSSATGMFVRLVIGSNLLDIPGGASIAPSNTTVISAQDFARAEEESALRAVEHVHAPSLASAATQRTVETAVEALADHNRWDRVIALTDSITPDSENVPVSLVTARMRALVRAGRGPEARGLAAGRGIMRSLQRSPDAWALLETADLLAAAGALDEAVETVKSASGVPGAPDVSGMIRRLELRRQLAQSPAIKTTPHFEIRATPDVAVTVAERIGDILEAELTRLMARFRLPSFRLTRVNVVNWKTFSSDVTGSQHVVGIYDGEITIPFADVARFREDVVSILTHELTHAIVAQASNETAPHWFQEGIASRMELLERHENIFQQRPGQQFVALALVEPTLLGSSDNEAVADAYVIAKTFMFFLEDVFGPDAPNRMIDSFRGGASTEEALLAVTGKNITDIDRDFRKWGLTHGGMFLDNTPWPYAQFYSLGIDPSVRDNIRFSRPRAAQQPQQPPIRRP